MHIGLATVLGLIGLAVAWKIVILALKAMRMVQERWGNWGRNLVWSGLLLMASVAFTATLWLTRNEVIIKPANCQTLAECGGQVRIEGYPRRVRSIFITSCPEGAKCALTSDILERLEPADYTLGLTDLNLTVYHKLGGFKEFYYQASEILGLLVILVAVSYVALGGYSLLKVKSLRKLPREFYCLAGLYLITAIIYVTCEHVSINCRPILLEDGLEASFPSSHTLMASIVLGAAVILNNYWYRTKELERLKIFKRAKVVRLLNILCSLLLTLTVLGRLLAGVHWLTDIIGGLFIAATLLAFFYAFLYRSPR